MNDTIKWKIEPRKNNLTFVYCIINEGTSAEKVYVTIIDRGEDLDKAKSNVYEKVIRKLLKK